MGENIKKWEQAIENIQNQSLKKILELPVTTPSTGLLMETGICPAKERIEYSTLMLIHQQQQRKDITKDYFRTEKEGNAKHTVWKN